MTFARSRLCPPQLGSAPRSTLVQRLGIVLACALTGACNSPPVLDLIERCNPDDPPVAPCECANGGFGEARCGSDGRIGECLCGPTDAGTTDAGTTDAGTPGSMPDAGQ